VSRPFSVVFGLVCKVSVPPRLRFEFALMGPSVSRDPSSGQLPCDLLLHVEPVHNAWMTALHVHAQLQHIL
jgi:hypothetical protein